MDSVLMDISLEIINVAFVFAFLTWVLLNVWRQRRDGGAVTLEFPPMRGNRGFIATAVLSNVIISTFYLGFGMYEYWKSRIIPWKSVIFFMTWFLSTLVTVYSMNRNLRGDKRWPLVLTVWWVFSGIFDSLSLSIYMITNVKSIDLPFLLPEPNTVDFASFPLVILLCFNALPRSCSARKREDIVEPLLPKENECSSHDDGAFTSAGIWSRLTFLWLNPIFKRGRIQKLESSHIPSVPQSETAENASLLLEESLRKQKFEASSLPKAIADATGKSLVKNAAFAGANTIASYMGPFLITNFVNFLLGKNDDSGLLYGLILAFIFFFAKTVESLTQRQWYFGAQRIGIRVRAALTVLIYKKSLSIKYGGLSNGKIINLINVDAERIGDFCWYIHGVWLLPVQVVLALIILYRNLGAAPSIAALCATILVMLCNTPLANIQERLHSKIMEAKDSRIKATSETLKSMRVLKLHSWEPTFLKKLLHLRETERSWLKRYLYTCSAVAFLFWASPTFVSVITFGVCIALNTPLTAGRVLSALATFRILQEPIYNLPELISMIAQTKVSIDRIQELLGGEDQKKLIQYHTSKSSNIAIEIEAGEYAWEIDDEKLNRSTVKVMEKMNIVKGYKVAICGPVGSGKSSLLSSILGEIPRISGAGIKIYGKKAYVPQSAWIQTGTIRENVLFGREMRQAYYITTARELARMVGIRKDPVLHHFSESIAGAATIRCFNQEDRFLTQILSLIDDYSRVAFYNSATMEWLCVRINFLFNLVFFLVLIILVGLPRSAVDPSLAGLAATYGLNLNVLQAWVIWNLCNVENKMISVERILQFTKIPSEAPLVIEDYRPKPEWPTDGRIELENLHVQYNPALPVVLKGITCTFPGQKKIGVVGRTGSGKSTLIQALFRVVEPAGGRILIDGVDICRIGLQDLRSRLGIIPQEPTLFQGTVRSNLDPVQQHSDQEIWEVLKKCHLVEIVKQDQRLLDAPVAEDGGNWSVGQRQLVCLARVLLKKRRVLVLDEATASIDTLTDNLIQETIKEETRGCTVITVAHRINTVIDNELVLVLDEGKVVEYDSPAQLLKDNSSAFSKLVTEFLRRSSKSNFHRDLS
ncbi:hypothetical protein I3760_05G169300 [Carya illinoinensis]|nr:hypothetical protein I3760_05G169300 [Carya illinoinensis]